MWQWACNVTWPEGNSSWMLRPQLSGFSIQCACIGSKPALVVGEGAGRCLCFSFSSVYSMLYGWKAANKKKTSHEVTSCNPAAF